MFKVQVWVLHLGLIVKVRFQVYDLRFALDLGICFGCNHTNKSHKNCNYCLILYVFMSKIALMLQKNSMFLHDNVYNKNISKMVQIGDETTHQGFD